MKVSLVYSPAPRQVREWIMEVAPGTEASGLLDITRFFEAFTDLKSHSMRLGVWGQKVDASYVLQPDDRLEVYRHLQVDPKVARRQRFKQQGSKGAGLFAGTRVGGKAGY